MEEEFNLKKFENKAFQVALMDGLIESTLGVVWLGFGIAYFLYDFLPSPLNSFLGLIITLIGAIFFSLCKFYVTRPRFGIVKLSERQKERSKRMLVLNFIAVVITVCIVIFTVVIPNTVFFAVLGALGFWTAVIFGLIPFIIMSWLGFAFKCNRFYLYGTIMGIGLFLFELLHQMNIPMRGLTLLISGGGVLAIGLYLFITFIRNNPVPKGEPHAQK